jgi:peptide/nickel transport system permease protein
MFLMHIRLNTVNAYGVGQPIWVRFADYYLLMLTSNFGYNVGSGFGVAGPVYSTISNRLPYTILLVFSSTLAVSAIYEVLRIVSHAKESRRLSLPPIAGFLILNGVVSGVFVWGMNAALHQGGSNWINDLLSHAAPRWYVPFGAGTLLKSGVAYDAAVLEALSLPFVTLTIVGLLILFLVRLANRGPLHYLTAFSFSLMSVLAWSLVVEPVFSWPGLGQAVYFGEVLLDLPLEQAAVFGISLIALDTIFLVYVGRDIMGFLLKYLGRRRGNPPDVMAGRPLDGAPQ